MHSVLIGLPIVDHWNHDTLDNRRGNLRGCSHAENMRNQKIHSSSKSGLKGVWWNKIRSKWQAQIEVGGIKKHLGLFLSSQDAARAYDTAAKEFHGEFAHLNFPDPQGFIVTDAVKIAVAGAVGGVTIPE
jgi:hypothetical protein